MKAIISAVEITIIVGIVLVATMTLYAVLPNIIVSDKPTRVVIVSYNVKIINDTILKMELTLKNPTENQYRVMCVNAIFDDGIGNHTLNIVKSGGTIEPSTVSTIEVILSSTTPLDKGLVYLYVNIVSTGLTYSDLYIVPLS